MKLKRIVFLLIVGILALSGCSSHSYEDYEIAGHQKEYTYMIGEKLTHEQFEKKLVQHVTLVGEDKNGNYDELHIEDMEFEIEGEYDLENEGVYEFLVHYSYKDFEGGYETTLIVKEKGIAITGSFSKYEVVKGEKFSVPEEVRAVNEDGKEVKVELAEVKEREATKEEKKDGAEDTIKEYKVIKEFDTEDMKTGDTKELAFVAKDGDDEEAFEVEIIIVEITELEKEEIEKAKESGKDVAKPKPRPVAAKPVAKSDKTANKKDVSSKKKESVTSNKSDGNKDKSTTQNKSKDKVEWRADNRTEKIPFSTENKNDGSLYKGETKVSRQGVDGVRTVRIQRKYVNGKATDETKNLGATVTKQPVSKIVLVGTKEKPKAPANGGNTGGTTKPQQPQKPTPKPESKPEPKPEPKPPVNNWKVVNGIKVWDGPHGSQGDMYYDDYFGGEIIVPLSILSTAAQYRGSSGAIIVHTDNRKDLINAVGGFNNPVVIEARQMATALAASRGEELKNVVQILSAPASGAENNGFWITIGFEIRR